MINYVYVGHDGSIGIANRHWLDGPRTESLWRQDFQHPSRPNLGAHPASYTMGNGSFPEVKRPGRGVHLPPHLALRLKKDTSYTSTPPLAIRGLF